MSVHTLGPGVHYLFIVLARSQFGIPYERSHVFIPALATLRGTRGAPSIHMQVSNQPIMCKRTQMRVKSFSEYEGGGELCLGKGCWSFFQAVPTVASCWAF